MYGPCLEGARVTLVPPRLEYAEDYVRWFGDPAVTRYLERRTPLTREREEDYLRHKADDATTVLWAILVGERHIGSALIHEIDWRSRTGATSIVLGEREVWGAGYATEAIGLRSAYAFGELGLETLTTEVFAPNEGSQRALEEAGYRQAGVLRRHIYLEGAFHDVWLGELLRAEWQAAVDVR